MNVQPDLEVLIIGAGLGGLGAGVRLQQEGLTDYIILEKSDDFGGTWHQNTYPGVACDVPAAFYSFGFAPNPEWTALYPSGGEIQNYLKGLAAQHKLRAHTRFGVEMLSAQFDHETARWQVQTSDGEYRARILIVATGSLEQPKLPDIPGLESFPGTIFHSSHWPEGYDGAGDRVAVIGTGASAIQFVPELQRRADRVTVFQRTPAWIYPRINWQHSRIERSILRNLPFARKALRNAARGMMEVFILPIYHRQFAPLLAVPAQLHLRLAVRDPELRRKLTPDYLIGCKRTLVSSNFYPAITSPNVDLVCSAVAEVRGNRIIAAAGSEHEADTLILGTGFHFADAPVYSRIRDTAGRPLMERWEGSPRAYKGTTMSGCPNAFILWGPNSGTGSGFFLAESQLRYVIDAIKMLRNTGAGSFEVRSDVEKEWKANADKLLTNSTQSAGTCATFYLDANGRNAALWPGSMSSMWNELEHFDVGNYVIAPALDSDNTPVPLNDGA